MVFALHGLGLRLDGAPASVARATEILAHFGATPAPDARPDLHVTFDADAAPTPAGEVTAHHLDLTVTRDDHGLWLASAAAVAWIDVDGVRSRTWVVRGDMVPIPVFTAVLFHQLRLRGGYALHAACVAEGEAGALIVGPSGTGKSTLTLALARQGLELVSDDSVLLATDTGHVHALALRRGIHLDPADHPDVDGTFVPCPLLEGTKQELVVAGVRRRASCDPVLLLIPELSHEPRTTFEPLSPVDACWALCAESRLPELDRRDAGTHLAVLGVLVGQVRAYRARLGTDVRTDPARVADELRALLAASRPTRASPERPEGLGPRAAPSPAGAPYTRLPDGSGVVLHPDDLAPIALDPQGARVWEALGEGLEAAVDALTAESGAPRDEVAAAVTTFAEELREAGIERGAP
ncbi:MAG: PqqD family peptide modification chaperone [Alphaproteobacteria bacterium]|nr:PqqD family peptide modification chaperone [Alphaproteobacteria bacterium]